MAAMEPASVDVVVTSPPYNLDLDYTLYHDDRGEADYLAWLVAVARAVARVLTPEGSFFLNLAGSASRPWLPFEIAVRLRPIFALQNSIAWIKALTVGTQASGHYKPMPGARFMHHTHEHVFHLTKTGRVALDRHAIGVPFADKSNIGRRGHARDLRCRGNSWFVPYATVRSRAQKYNHPGTFPVELPLWCIYLAGRAAAVVLDPFAGAGSTLVAAQWAGATGIGIEIDPHYVAATELRLAEDAASSRPVLLDSAEMAALLQSDLAVARGLADRLNKTTGALMLTAPDLARAAAWLTANPVEAPLLARLFQRGLAAAA